jgi:hypothetical protein
MKALTCAGAKGSESSFNPLMRSDSEGEEEERIYGAFRRYLSTAMTMREIAAGVTPGILLA